MISMRQGLSVAPILVMNQFMSKRLGELPSPHQPLGVACDADARAVAICYEYPEPVVVFNRERTGWSEDNFERTGNADARYQPQRKLT